MGLFFLWAPRAAPQLIRSHIYKLKFPPWKTIAKPFLTFSKVLENATFHTINLWRLNVGLLSLRHVESGAAACCGQAWWEQKCCYWWLKRTLRVVSQYCFWQNHYGTTEKDQRGKQFSETHMILQEWHSVGFYYFLQYFVSEKAYSGGKDAELSV